jgi:hypothetical protein
MSKPRRHHYLPQFYLAGFTSNGSREGRLQVIDLEMGKGWPAKPAGVAHQVDYYRLADGEQDPFAVEKGLSKFESEAAVTLKAVIEHRAIPSLEHRVMLMNFIAVTALRVPHQRNIIAHARRRSMKMTMSLMVESKDRWERLKERAKEAGFINKDVPYETARDFALDESQYTIKLDRGSLIATAFSALDNLIPLLLRRRWWIAIAEEGAGDFVCSDNPVARHWTVDSHPPRVPGFGEAPTSIVFPLDRRMVLVGDWTGDEMTVEVGRETVAYFNSIIISAADRFIIHPDRSFWWYMWWHLEEGRFAHSDELLAWFKAHPKPRRLAREA